MYFIQYMNLYLTDEMTCRKKTYN